ncbi:MAG: chromosomal replication initiator protein DnaA [Firmicutes bacterium]|nr:chromosomal replication initiator protein DnaA [Bacillota bacterium]
MENLDAVWAQALALLERELPRPSFETYLRKARPLGFYDDLFLVAVPNDFVRSYVEGKLSAQVRSNLSLVLNRDVAVEFVTPDKSEAAAALDWDERPAAAPADDAASPASYAAAEFDTPALNPKYTFDTFVVGSGNRLAHAAALAVAEAPAKAYNPLFLYGGVGLGKTHLMQAIAHTVLKRDPRRRVVYISSETFANEMINSIRDRRTVEFKARYRNVDILLVDDIQFLAGKESTQEEFFHTFNALYEAERQIVLSSDRPPKDIPTLEERLRSRFEWGLISDIQPPDLETRIAILRKKAQLDRLKVPDDVLLFIAERIDTNIRELEGALIRLVAYASLHQRTIDFDLAQDALKDILPQKKTRAITVRLIQDVVAEHFMIDHKDFKIRKRTRQVAFARQVAMYLCRELTDLSLPRIGEEFGGRDHTTVLHAHEKISRELKTDPELRQTIQHLRKRITG